MQRESYGAVCIADLPPSASSKSRSLAKRLRAIDPELPIVVGRWAPPPLADENDEALRAAGAMHVAARLIESGDYLSNLFPVPPKNEVAKPHRRFVRFRGDPSPAPGESFRARAAERGIRLRLLPPCPPTCLGGPRA